MRSGSLLSNYLISWFSFSNEGYKNNCNGNSMEKAVVTYFQEYKILPLKTNVHQ